MAKVTSKLQVTVPKAVADRFGIRPGDEITWVVDGDSIRVHRVDAHRPLSLEERLAIFDDATRRQDQRDRASRRLHGGRAPRSRGWTREALYTRGGAR